MSGKMKIRLLPNGEIQMETVGVKGKKCLDYVKVFQNLIKVKITNKELTDEYYESESEIVGTGNTEIRLD